MNKNLYVGNLASHTTDDDLTQAFSHYGAVVRAFVVTNPDTGESRGFGHVEMSEGADEAVVGLSGSLYQGRSLTVHQTKATAMTVEAERHDRESIPVMPENRFGGYSLPIFEDTPNKEGAWGSIKDDYPATRDADAFNASQDGEGNDRG